MTIYMELVQAGVQAGVPVEGEILTISGLVELNAIEQWVITVRSWVQLATLDKQCCLWIRDGEANFYVHGRITQQRTTRVTSDEFETILTLQCPLVALTRRQQNGVLPSENYSATIQHWLDEFSEKATLIGTWPQHLALTCYGSTHWDLLQDALSRLKKFSYIEHEKNDWKIIIGDAFPSKDVINLNEHQPSGLTTTNWRCLSREKILGLTKQWKILTNHPLLRLGHCVQLDDQKQYRIVKMKVEVNPHGFHKTIWVQENWEMLPKPKIPMIQHHFAKIANRKLQLEYGYSVKPILSEPAHLLQLGSQEHGCLTEMLPNENATAFVSYLNGDLQHPIVQGYLNIPSIAPHEQNIWRGHGGYQITMEDREGLRLISPDQKCRLELNFSPEHEGIEIISKEGDIEWLTQGDWYQKVGMDTRWESSKINVNANSIRGYSDVNHHIQCQKKIAINTRYDTRWKAKSKIKIRGKTSSIQVKEQFQLTGQSIGITSTKFNCESLKNILLKGNIRVEVGEQTLEMTDQAIRINARNIQFNAPIMEFAQETFIQ